MSHPAYTTHYPVPSYPANAADLAQVQAWQQAQLLINAAKTGAIIGAAGVGAEALHRYQNQQVSWQDAAKATAKGAVTTGLATAAATAVSRIFKDNSATSSLAALATGTAMMYLLTQPKKHQQ